MAILKRRRGNTEGRGKVRSKCKWNSEQRDAGADYGFGLRLF